MPRETIYIGETPCPPTAGRPSVDFAEIAGETWVVLDHADAMSPFFMSIVGASDMWLFAGSNGPFTSGRVEPDRAIFPYQTADKIMRDGGASGGLTIMLVRRGTCLRLWEPWHGTGMPYRTRRRLMKHMLGAGVVFEETNEDLGLRFSWELATCERFGLVRRCSLEDLAGEPVSVRCLDGFRYMIAPGVNQETYARLSYLAAGYMRHERVQAGPSALGVYTLNAAIADRAEPVESLRAGVAWGIGLPGPTVLLTERQVGAFRRGEPVQGESEVRGQFGAMLLASEFRLEPGESQTWATGADTWLDPPGIVTLRNALRDPESLERELERAIAADREALRRLVGSADGLQASADRSACAHHAANVVFNCMRGGTFADGGRFPSADLARFVRQRNRAVADAHATWLAGLPATLALSDLRSAGLGIPLDPHLRRIVGEYLPVTFSRRHGDPSRPWNDFAIRLKDEHGRPLRTYQGNWRDIFQNWEALARSFPDALEPMISTFLSASTADGYNPYRIARDGVDWEVADPGDVWGHYGYWGDHQIVYLLRLLEAADMARPGALSRDLRGPRYAYARVPYEIAGLDAMLADPRNTVTFNQELHDRLMARAAEVGGDGKLLAGSDGAPVLANLAEKLLVPLLAKLTNLVPGGGIWLNTQRPEWNDANNALAGWGLSVVTTCYIRRYLVWLDGILSEADDDPIPISAAVAELMDAVASALRGIGIEARGEDGARLVALRILGEAGQAYRRRVYSEGLVGCVPVEPGALRALIASALPVIEETIRASRRPDGLYNSYNVLSVHDGGARVRNLGPMLEGQVAVLSSGMLSPDEALAVCNALRASSLYRPDQGSYLLYPDRALPSYLAKSRLPEHALAAAPVLAELIQAGDATLADRDADGALYFSADLRNARDVADRLDALGGSARWAQAAGRDSQAVLDLWEEVFRHSEFTGRSGCFFMFEGLGSIYWHMVAKLLLAVQECFQHADRTGASPATISCLSDAYHAIRDGLGFRKPPEVYGAFPTDPYSHSPRHMGAQQPGMTGQVKEEILTRWGELGVTIERGLVRFGPSLLNLSEFQGRGTTFEYVDAVGEPASYELPAQSLGFTCCGTPVCYVLGDAEWIEVERRDGAIRCAAEPSLTASESAHVLGRTGGVRRVVVTIPRGDLAGGPGMVAPTERL